ncbi:dUTP diphosphatase [Oceaniglobus trochenteri]|uniref:dUTP diphosphatase n=1 Tax=Oceaniglobus trochenteri TaxID=2763260 RepID=UPI001D001301|nr:dUTP diphosphatase [Oceaniglobus trochenteri]
MTDDGDSNPVVAVMREDWADPAVDLPAYATQGAAGADVRANLPEAEREGGFLLRPMERRIVPTGLKIAIPAGFEVQIRPRSGLALKHGISLPNTPGTIDSDYRGPLGVLLINLSDQPYTILHGERIAQMIVAPVVQARFMPVTAMDATPRGAGGFGSTGRA